MDSSDKNTGSSWCSICNVNVDGGAASDHYESRTHLNRCLQKGVGISLVPTSGGFTNKLKPRMTFPQASRPMAFGAKKFPAQPFTRGQTPSNPRMAVPYGGGYGQDMRSSDNFNQYDSSWQNQSSVKNGWPYCETCDQNFQTVGALSQHYSSSAHMEMKMMKPNQYHGPAQGSGEQTRFYQGSTSHVRAQAQNQGQYFGNQGAAHQDHYRGSSGQNQGSHYASKDWRPFSRTVQFLS